MTAPAISHVICSAALIMLIFLMPFFYSAVSESIHIGMMERELQEIADYVSSTLSNLYFLVNFSNARDVSMQKSLIFLPAAIENLIFILRIEAAGTDVTQVITFLKSNPSVARSAWIGPGLQVGSQNSVESGGKSILLGCTRNATCVFAWLTYE